MEQEPREEISGGIENLPPQVHIGRKFIENKQHELELGVGNISPDTLKEAQEILFTL